MSSTTPDALAAHFLGDAWLVHFDETEARLAVEHQIEMRCHITGESLAGQDCSCGYHHPVVEGEVVCLDHTTVLVFLATMQGRMALIRERALLAEQQRLLDSLRDLYEEPFNVSAWEAGVDVGAITFDPPPFERVSLSTTSCVTGAEIAVTVNLWGEALELANERGWR